MLNKFLKKITHYFSIPYCYRIKSMENTKILQIYRQLDRESQVRSLQSIRREYSDSPMLQKTYRKQSSLLRFQPSICMFSINHILKNSDDILKRPFFQVPHHLNTIFLKPNFYYICLYWIYFCIQICTCLWQHIFIFFFSFVKIDNSLKRYNIKNQNLIIIKNYLYDYIVSKILN